MIFLKKVNRRVFRVILLLFLLFPFSAWALAVGGLGILPANPDPSNPLTKSWFIYTMERGEEKEDAVNIFNNTDDEVVVKVYPVDATTTADGNFTLVDEYATQTGIGAWVELFVKEVGLKPQEVKKIPLIIKVPDNADVGDHMGGIIIQEISRGSGVTPKEGMAMNIITRIGVRIYLTVPGERIEKLDIIDYGYLFISRAKNFWEKFLNLNYVTDFILTLKNEGNVRIEPVININIKNIFGKTVEELNGQIGMVFPKKDSTLHLKWEKPLFFGRYTAAMSVKYGTDKETEVKKIVLWAVPYKLITILAGLVVVIVLIRLIILYFIEVKKEKMPIYIITKKETIQELAEKFKVNWAKLARINKLKKPYELKKGQKLFIPYNRRNQPLLKVLLEKKILEVSIQEKLGKARQSFFYKIHRGKQSLKILLIALVILLVGGGLTTLFLVSAKKQKIVQTAVEIIQPTASEDKSRTKGGELKRSEIKLAIAKNASTNDNVEKLWKKLQFVGFPIETITWQAKQKYTKTTFEIKKDGQEAATAVQVALGLNRDDIDFIEIDELEDYDVVIAYFIGVIFDLELPPVTDFDKRILEFGNENTNTQPANNNQSLSNSEISVVVLNGGALAGTAGTVANTLKQADFSQTTAGNADNFNYQGVIIYYQPNFSTTASEIKQILSDDYSNIQLEEKADLNPNIQVLVGA